ncbi:GDSL-type esterase/lipase family protein [Kitasatospora sp. NBC_00070]|uniref:SGNH/GDSL hydrolase family protein n=1 Tax=Kitasatospora sp. NBC_00070 TaxID=2975962 RepID=UPI00324FF182
MTTPYSPETATALAIGATTAGYVEGSGPTWDDDIATYNLREADRRASILALYQRDAIAALHRALLPPTATVRVLCAGDSITLGTGSTDGAGYRPWLASLLVQRRINTQFTVIAQGGKTMREMTPAILAALPAACPDIVLIAFGTNDAAQPDLTDWAARCGQLVDQILASSPTVRVVVARPALSRAAWLTTGEAAVDAAVDTVVNARKTGGRAASADMTTVPQRWTGDGVHPLDAGYLLMAQRWTDAINPWLPTPA